MIWAFDVDSPRADFAQAFFSAMLKQGCLVRPIGKTVYFMPPYVMQPEEMEQLFQATCTVLDALHQEKRVDRAGHRVAVSITLPGGLDSNSMAYA
jgi:adenosylmethionine-8-amino-7-oxononanoate aminotransferase